MSDRPRSMSTQEFYDRAPTSYLTVNFLTAAAIGASLLFLAGLTITGTVIALILATPLLVLFSPILVPAGMVTFLAAAGFLFSGGCGVTAITLLSWVYGYVTGKHPPGADQLDYARMKIADKAREMKERAKEYGQYVQHKAQEANQGY
ncbi:hypothetical protein Pint_12895 [Pistacia integerrima]|uniref:Uncharacterized protein n=1 Tax=Pistacia integerrima TaxID=434235 RepID=A0ACC0Y9P7_9ROSI|nr:hypothetical protein Pint_12895 [Pistacia integerrima]